jgi:hypothetical protein
MSTWVPTIFDNAVGTCAQFVETAKTDVYPIVKSMQGFCAGVGNIMSTEAVTTTTRAPITTVPVIFPFHILKVEMRVNF